MAVQQDKEFEEVSAREGEIATLASKGLTDKEMSLQLGIKEGTLRVYWDRMRAKLHCKSRSHVVATLLRSQFGKLQKEMEVKYQMLDLFFLAAAGHALIVMDPEGKTISWHPGVQSVLGYTEEEFIGMSLADLYTAEARAAGQPAEDMLAARDSGPVPEIGWHERKGGERFWASGMLFAIWDHELLGFGKIMRDASLELKAKG